MFKLNKITTFILFILASHSSFKACALRSNGRLTGDACSPANCETLEGVLLCFSEQQEFQKYAHEKAFFKTQHGSNVRKKVSVPQKAPITIDTERGEELGPDEHSKYTNIQINTAVINHNAYQASKKLAEANRQCMRAFARKNCFSNTTPIDEREIRGQAWYFKNSDHHTYYVKRIGLNQNVYLLNDSTKKRPRELEAFSEKYLMDKRDTILSDTCLGGRDEYDDEAASRGARMRMFCTLAVDSTRMNPKEALPACTSFDPAKETE